MSALDRIIRWVLTPYLRMADVHAKQRDGR